LFDELDTDLRLRVTAAEPDVQTFIGIGPAADVDAYLGRVAHDDVIGLTNGIPMFRTTTGASKVSPPTDQTFWAAITTGTWQLNTPFRGGIGRLTLTACRR
jgi:hypothetical protein